jgi:hypothetical protein
MKHTRKAVRTATGAAAPRRKAAQQQGQQQPDNCALQQKKILEGHLLASVQQARRLGAGDHQLGAFLMDPSLMKSEEDRAARRKQLAQIQPLIKKLKRQKLKAEKEKEVAQSRQRDAAKDLEEKEKAAALCKPKPAPGTGLHGWEEVENKRALDAFGLQEFVSLRITEFDRALHGACKGACPPKTPNTKPPRRRRHIVIREALVRMAARGAFERFGRGAYTQAMSYMRAALRRRRTPGETGIRIWVRVCSTPNPLPMPLPSGLCSFNTPYVKSEKFLESSIEVHGEYAVGPRPVEELAFLLKGRHDPELEKMVVDKGGGNGWREILYGSWGLSEKDEKELVMPLLKKAKDNMSVAQSLDACRE